MKALSIRCPTCNASLRVRGDATMVTCEYCHATCQLQPRTSSWQRQAPPPVPRQVSGPAPAPRQVTAPPQPAPARQATGALTAFLVLGVVVLGAGGAGAMFFAMRAASPRGPTPQPLRSTTAEAQAPAAPEPPRLEWGSGLPLLRDLDGDGDEDVLGLARLPQHTTLVVAAYSGVTGLELWRSAPVPPAAGERPTLALTGDVLLLWGEDGVLRSYPVRGGEPGWEAPLGEKVEGLCEPSPQQVLVLTADDQVRTLTLPGGALGEARPARRRDRGCARLATNRANTYGLTTYRGFYGHPKVPGMYAQYHVRRDDVVLVAGDKSPGTEVPMVARVDGKRVTWQVELPSSDRLTAQQREDHLVFDGDTVLATYQTSRSSQNTVRLVALAAADGRRLWEVPIPSEWPGVLTRRLVLVPQYDKVLAFDRESGAPRFTIGE